MRTVLVIRPPPRFDLASGVGQRQEPMNVQAFIAQPPVEEFHEGIIRHVVAGAAVHRV